MSDVVEQTPAGEYRKIETEIIGHRIAQLLGQYKTITVYDAMEALKAAEKIIAASAFFEYGAYQKFCFDSRIVDLGIAHAKMKADLTSSAAAE